MLLAGGDDPLNAFVVLPQETDSTLSRANKFQPYSFANLSVDLFGLGGAAGGSTITAGSDGHGSEGCVAWPRVQLSKRPRSLWKIGFVSGKAVSIGLDPVEKMISSDSNFVISELARLASAVTVNGDQSFRGLPFTVKKAYRLIVGDTSVIIGSVVRKINEEANPREEQLLLVAERAGMGGSYVLAFQSRSAGSEDAVRTNGVLSAIRFIENNKLAIVISFEYDDGGQVALLERVASHEWMITWRSAYTGC